MNNKKIEFELATEEDIEKLIEIAVRAFEKDLINYGAIPPGIDTAEWHSVKIMGGMYYKILCDSVVVGAMNLYIREESHYRLGSIFIDPEYQNLGIGSKAIAFIEDKYKHVKKWSLDTPFKNSENQKFYEGKGYKKIGESKIDIPGGKLFILFDYEKSIE